MATNSEEYEITFTAECREKLDNIKIENEHIDEALREVYHALKTNPYEFNVVPPLTHFRAAKTQFYFREGVFVPPLTLYFRIVEDDKIVKIFDVMVRKGFGKLD